MIPGRFTPLRRQVLSDRRGLRHDFFRVHLRKSAHVVERLARHDGGPDVRRGTGVDEVAWQIAKIPAHVVRLVEVY